MAKTSKQVGEYSCHGILFSKKKKKKKGKNNLRLLE